MAFRTRSILTKTHLKLAFPGESRILYGLCSIKSLGAKITSQVVSENERSVCFLRSFCSIGKVTGLGEDLNDKLNSNQRNPDLYDVIDRSKFTIQTPLKYADMGAGNGKIKQWMKEEGDIVSTGDMLCDIQTDLFTFGLEIDDEGLGILKEKKVREGEEFEPGTIICVLLHEQDDG